SSAPPSQRSPGWLRVLVHTCHDRQLERTSGRIAGTRGHLPSALALKFFCWNLHQQQKNAYQKRKAQ
ncbi:hypothetical protein B0H65DRAFT_391001, partial [Neurospora tetraspora]